MGGPLVAGSVPGTQHLTRQIGKVICPPVGQGKRPRLSPAGLDQKASLAPPLPGSGALGSLLSLSEPPFPNLIATRTVTWDGE